jgi:uncharacterized protein (TIGR02246 family)
MNTKRLICLVSAAALVALLPISARTVENTDGEEARDVLSRYEKALNASDAEGVTKLYTPDAVLMAPNNNPAVGRETIHNVYEGLFKAVKLEIKFEVDEIELLSDQWAFARTRSKFTVNVVGTDLPPQADANQELFLLQKEDDGQWRIARYSYSSTHPQPKPASTGAAKDSDSNASTADGHTLYVNPAIGADTNSGEKGNPLRTLAAAAMRVNESKDSGPMTVMLSEGVYAVGETALFQPKNRKFSKDNRLTIRAEVLPDDPEWDTGRMPTLIHTMPPARRGFTFGIHVETSHVTIRGLKLLGMPVVETPRPRVLNRIYPIGRVDPRLEDLEIAQCVFAGDKFTNPLHLGVLANGSGINVHHCVFRGVKLTVVYWTAGSTGHAMTNCVVDGAYGSGVWTTEIADDFIFRNNVFANGNYVWTYQSGAVARSDPDVGQGAEKSSPAPEKQRAHYRVIDSVFAGNKKMTSSGTGASLGFKDIDSSFLDLVGTKVSEEAVAVESDETRKDYLHPVAGSEAAKIGAGLFLRRTE